METLFCRTSKKGCALCLLACAMAFTSTLVSAQVNSWINPTSDAWDDATSWSLGVLPSSSQSVMITNSNWKAVAINPSTPINYPGSMTVSNLTIVGATNTENTLLLNYFGTTVPLTVLNGLTLRDYAQIVNFDSGVFVEGGNIIVTNSQINQDGGFFFATSPTSMDLEDAEYNLTNGDFQGGVVFLGTGVPASFNQYGGSAVIANLQFGRGSSSAGGTYALYGGNLSLPNGLLIMCDYGASSSYFQAGGTNQTTFVTMEPGLFGGHPSFTLNGGLLADNGVTLDADDFGPVTLTQNGGTHLVTNALNILGSTGPDPSEIHPGVYQLNGGALSAGSMNMDATFGPVSFNITNGTAQVGSIQARPSQEASYFVASVNLSSGSLSCSNFFVTDGGKINQTGGALVVSNSLDFNGYIEPGPKYYSTYQFAAGTLSASNILVGGTWIIGDSVGTISNPGTCTLSHTLQIGNAPEQLGRFILADTGVIDLVGSASQLSFAKSSGESWTSSAMLEVTDWNGNISGGGAEQLKFGTDQSGLTAAQLNQVRFHIGTNLYSAKILSTGELVPDQVVTPPLNYVKQGNNFILSWLPGYILQTSTNASGPYANVSDPTMYTIDSPYTNNMAGITQRFFRLKPGQ